MFLHELGHNLGAAHEPTEDTLMNPSYSHHSSTFSADAHAAIQRTLDHRLGREAAVVAQLAPPAPLAPLAPELPTSGTNDPSATARISIHITDRGTIIDGNPLDEAGQQALFEHADRKVEVIIFKDRSVPAIVLTDTIARVKAAGLTHLTVV